VHDLALARRELGHLRGRPRRQQDPVEPRIDVRAARRDALDRADELLHRAGLERVPAGAGVEPAVEQLGVGVAGVEDDAEAGPARKQLARELDPAAVRQADVDDRDVRLAVIDEIDARRDVASGSDDLQAVAFQQGDEPFAEGLVVVDDHELGHRAARSLTAAPEGPRV
jgi:hypothetical protein